MKSLDTNVLLYALNADCPEHPRARALIDRTLETPDEWIVAEQVYFELYRLLRNPAVLAAPLPATEAAKTIAWFRDRSGWLHCAYEPGMMNDVSEWWTRDSFHGRATFDLVLGVTLAANGVQELFTRNIHDFLPFGLFALHNPIDGE